MSRKLITPCIWLLLLSLIGCRNETVPLPVEPQTDTQSLYIFGDSWADQMDDGQLQRDVADRDFDTFVTVYPYGIGGTTMDDWANDARGMRGQLTAAIVNDPNPNPIVFFTLSGNDLLGGRSTDEILADLEQLLTELENIRDDLHIVFATYDILNPQIDARQCNGLINNLFGSLDPATVNANWVQLYDLTAAVVDQFDRTTTVNTFGSLQGRPGNPDLASWSPEDYLADCIHLNDDGYDLWLDTVFDEALTPLICRSAVASTAQCA